MMRAEMKENVSTSSDYFLNYSITKPTLSFSPKKRSIPPVMLSLLPFSGEASNGIVIHVPVSKKDQSPFFLATDSHPDPLKEDNICDQTLSKRALLAGWALAGTWKAKGPKRMQSRGILSFGSPDTAVAVGLWLLCRDANNVTQVLSGRGLWHGKMRAIEFADAHHMAAWKGFIMKDVKRLNQL